MPIPSQDAKTVAKNVIIIITKQAYLPTTLILDKESAFVSQVTKEASGVLRVTLKHAPTKQVQTIGIIQQCHASIKQPLKIGAAERRSLLQKYVSIAVLIYHTLYHASFGCEPNRIFHRRISYISLDSELGPRLQKASMPIPQNAQFVL